MGTSNRGPAPDRKREMQEDAIPPRLLDVNVNWAKLNTRSYYTPCLLCGSSRLNPVASVLINRLEFFLVRCDNCGVVFRTPMPDDQFLNDLYSDEYFDVAGHDPQLVYQVGIPDTHQHNQERRRTLTEAEIRNWVGRGFVNHHRGTVPRFLEIGGGRGYLQRAAASVGWEALGIELSRQAIRTAMETGLRVLPVTLEALVDACNLQPRYFDVIAMFDFLEHVPNPAGVLRLARELLHEDGTLVIRVPVTDDLPRLHLVDHIWHFSGASLNRLLVKERFFVRETRDSGLFSDPDGQSVQNVTLFASCAA